MTSVGVIAELRRYPVKSMRGETRDVLSLDRRGVVGDRSWAVYDSDSKLGSGKNTNRFRRMDGLFNFAAAYVGDEPGAPRITFPDGSTRSAAENDVDTALTRALDIPVRLRSESANSHFDSSPVHLVTTTAVRRMQELLPETLIDQRRFRPNLVISTDNTVAESFAEDAWVGREIRIGDVRLAIVQRTQRCVMVNNEQEELTHDRRVLKTVTRANDLCLGVYAEVRAPGAIHHGDTVELVWGGHSGSADLG